MEKMKIGIDIDEVVVEFVKPYLEFHKENYNVDFSFDKINSYNFWETEMFENKEMAIEGIKLFQETDIIENLNFIGGFKNSFNFLVEDFKPFFITARPDYIKEKTLNFFEKHFPNHNFEIIFSGDFFGGKKTKSQICNELDIKIMVEDNADYALDCAKKGIKVFLLDKPWNQNYENHENIIKVKNWDEIMEGLKLVEEKIPK